MVDINVIKAQDHIVAVAPKDRYILETYLNSARGERLLSFVKYDPEKNMVENIADNLLIPAYIDVQNVIWESKDLFFPVLSSITNSVQQIDICRYSFENKMQDVFYSFIAEGYLDGKEKRLKVFILSENSILIQEETLDDTSTEKRMGHIRFTQKIVDLESGTEVDVHDENINNNGLNRIIPISASQIMTKTGYSYLEDDRFEARSETDALIESVFVHTTSRFIADLSIGANSIDAYLIMSTYYKQYILQPRFKDDQIFFMTVDPDAETSECVFYNCLTGEQLTCKNETLHMDDLNISFVIAGNPYVKNTAGPETRFLNLRTMEFDLSEMDEEFVDIIGDLFILRSNNRKKEPVLEFYHYPDMTKILEEKGTLITGCKNQDDYFIYIQS